MIEYAGPNHESRITRSLMYAVIETGGKQYRVEEGRTLKVERLQAEPGASVTLDKVLLVADGSTAKVGSPVVEGTRVTASVVGHGKAKKIIGMKNKSKDHNRQQRRHQTDFT